MEQLQFSSLLRPSDILMKQANNWCLIKLDYHLAINNVYCIHLKGRLGVYLGVVRTFFRCYKVTHRPKSPWFLVQNAIYSIGGMELRPLEDLATSQEGLVSPTQLTDLYLLYHRFGFVTENV